MVAICNRRDGRHAEPDGLADAVINVAFADEITGQLVVRGEGAIGGVGGVDEREQVFEIAFRAAFAQQNVHARAGASPAPPRASVDS